MPSRDNSNLESLRKNIKGLDNENIQFLKDLQEELKNQDNDCQASPRYWTVGDYRMDPCPEEYQDEYHVNAPNRDYYGSLDELLDQIKEEEFGEYSEDAKEEFEEIECEISGIDWIKKHYDEDADLIPVREEHFVHPNTMFLTKAEAKKHLELNYYHYSKQAHTYAMIAWRAPKVERLLNILETIDWDSL
ncbi:MAG: hypothetical protein ACFFDF_08660 [Candidatus Odinarchaeota archaeon]